MADTLELLLLAVALAMDCFTVSTVCGVILRRRQWRTILLTAFFFGAFQAFMPYIGWLGTSLFARQLEAYDHWIAFSLLAYLGGRMIWEDLHPGSEPSGSSPMLTTRRILVLSVATSIDALAVGISLACLPADSLLGMGYMVGVIGICSTALSITGLAAGITIGRRVNWHARAIGGSVLLIIGIKVLIEHLT